MPRVLLLLPTTTYRTEAFMQAARQLGVQVTVASEEPSTMTELNPAGLLTVDLDNPGRAAEQAAEFSRRHPIAAVVAVDDRVASAGAAIANALRLPANPLESVLAARNKYAMRQALEKNQIPQPAFQLHDFNHDLHDIARRIDYPCVIKPLELAASQGVMRINEAIAFPPAVRRLKTIIDRAAESHDGSHGNRSHGTTTQAGNQFLVEQFVPGPEFAVEAMLTHGRLAVIAIFDKPDPLDGPYFEETIYVTPSRLDAADQNDLVDVTDHACRALGLVHGPVHAELRLPGSRAPRVIEVNPRSIGGLCSRVLRFATGMSLEELIIRHALDSNLTLPAREGQSAGVMMIPIPRAGILQGVGGLDAARSVANIEDVVISARVGQPLVPLPDGALYLGFIFARAATPESVEAALRRAHERLKFQIE